VKTLNQPPAGASEEEAERRMSIVNNRADKSKVPGSFLSRADVASRTCHRPASAMRRMINEISSDHFDFPGYGVQGCLNGQSIVCCPVPHRAVVRFNDNPKHAASHTKK